MPETEPKPRLIELVGAGAGQGWKAVLKNGKAVVVHEIPVPGAEAAAAAPRLQRLYDHRHPALSPVLGWGTDANGVWIAVEPNEGTPLGSILTRGPFTPPAAAALGAAVLSGIAALHEAGIAMGGFNASAVRVTSNGDVRLAGHPAAAVRGAPSQSDLRADVRSCGMAVCAAFGVDPAGAPAPPNIPPGLVVTMRSMASGAMGPAADRAMAALREMASALLAPDRQVAAQSELALRSGGREVPPVTPFLPKDMPPSPAPAASVAPAPAAAAGQQGQPLPEQYVAPVRREGETPVRVPVSYDAPERPLQTYGGVQSHQSGAAPVAPAPAPAAPAAPVAPAPPADPEPAAAPAIPVAEPIPTWAEAAPRAPAFETVPPAAATNPPVPAAEPMRETFPPAPAESPPRAPAFETVPPVAAAPPVAATPPVSPSAPGAGASPFESFPPAAAAAASAATSAAAAVAPVNAPAAARPAPAWSAVEQPVWQPGEVSTPIPGTLAATPGAVSAEPALAPAQTIPPAAIPAAAPARATAVPARGTAVPARRPPAPRRPSIAFPSERPSWMVPAAVGVIVVLLILIVAGFALSRLHGTTTSGNNHPIGTSTPSAKGSPKASPSPSSVAIHEVPTLAPAAAGQVQAVQFCTTAMPCPFTGDKDTTCQIDGPCSVDVGVIFTTTYTGSYSYDIMYFDRCTGAAPQTLYEHTDTSRGFRIGEPAAVIPLQLPAGAKSAALFVVTRTPAGAQSAPLKLGADSCA